MSTANSQSGFTLIEVMLVTAVSGLLIVIAIVGQHQLQAKARFDAQVNQTIQDIDYARDFATSNINDTGPGNTTRAEVVGDVVEFDTADPLGKLVELEGVYANYNPAGKFQGYDNTPHANPGACAGHDPSGDGECYEQYFGALTTAGFTISRTDGTPLTGAQVLFLHNPPDQPGTSFKVCAVYDDFTVPDNMCAASVGTIDLVITDSSGQKATIEVDGANGYAKRL